MFTICSLYIHYILTICSLYIYYLVCLIQVESLRLRQWRRFFYSPGIFTICSLYVHYILTIYSLYTHHIFTICSLYTHYELTIYSLSYLSNPSRIIKIEVLEAVLWLIKRVYFILTHPVYSLYVHYMFTIYSLYTHYMFIIYLLSYLFNPSRIFKIEAMDAVLWLV